LVDLRPQFRKQDGPSETLFRHRQLTSLII
jgi:hypothetical protein